MPLTFVYLGAAVRKAGFEPVIYDAMTKRHGFKEIEQRIREESPAYVATTTITSTTPDALKVLELARSIDPAVKTIVGGVHASFLYQEMLSHPYVDYVVREEGEETLPELLLAVAGEEERSLQDVRGIAFRDASGNAVASQRRPFIEDLDELETAWDLLDWEDYTYFVIQDSRLASVSSSRGCNHSCTFCSQQKFWRQSWRARRAESVVDEICMLRNEYGVNVVLITDEYPTRDAERWEKMLDLLIEADMGVYLLMETRPEDIVRDRDILWKYRKAGVIHIYIGVEATNQETLDLIRKDVSVQMGIEAIKLIHEHGMVTETSFILGFPHETKDSIKRTLELSKIYNPDCAHYLALAPWPYAEMYDDLEPYVVDFDYRKYNLIDPVIKPESMTVKDIDWAIINCYRSFYMDKLMEVMALKDPFKKQYMIHSMKLIMNSSFIVDKLGSLGKMPPQVQAVLSRISSI
jgi:anaerobic magnesium-protoporphyrin IX monomethyl ester cyclase